MGAASGKYLPANRVLVAEHLNQRPSVYDDRIRAIAEQAGVGAFDFRNAVDDPTAEEIANIINNGGKTFLTPDGTAGDAVGPPLTQGA